MRDTLSIQDWLVARKPADEISAAAPSLKLRAPVSPNRGAGMLLSKLDDRHKTILRQLFQRPSWTLAELRQLTCRMGLMPLACLATLNEWAADTYGDVLLEGEEIINVNMNLKQRIQI